MADVRRGLPARTSRAGLWGIAFGLLTIGVGVVNAGAEGTAPPRYPIVFLEGQLGLPTAGELSGLELQEPPIGFGVLGGYEFNPHLAAQIEIAGASASYKGPPPPAGPFTVYSEQRGLGMLEVAVSAMGRTRMGSFEPFVKAGLGYFHYSMLVSGITIGFADNLEGAASSIGPLAAVGLHTWVTRSLYLGVEWTRLWASENLGAASNNDSVEIPTMFMLSLGYRFER